jgi:16S rRNA (cytosine1402-N4)-methyltransferase
LIIENCELKINSMSIHKPVLLGEAIDLLQLKSGMIVVDATLGGGGHSREILKTIKNGKLIAIDADVKAIENFKKEASEDKRIILVNDNFANLENILKSLKIEKVNSILADLGWSSDQLEGKGMSFQKDEELDMRLDRNQKITAKDIVNEYSENELGRVIKEYGEERFWKKITRKIVEYRINKKIETTRELAEIIEKSVPGKFRHLKIHPATRVFQALRIETNQELENLEKFIPAAIKALEKEGRLAIISFHSLEDRIVKKIFRENARGRILTDEITGRPSVETAPTIKLITKKPIIAGQEEISDNPRARSAKLRVCEML